MVLDGAVTGDLIVKLEGLGPRTASLPQGTPEEQAACGPDLQRYCEAALPDTMRVLACLQSNRSRISNACNRVLVSHGQ
jgi:hypothetical protein